MSYNNRTSKIKRIVFGKEHEQAKSLEKAEIKASDNHMKKIEEMKKRKELESKAKKVVSFDMKKKYDRHSSESCRIIPTVIITGFNKIIPIATPMFNIPGFVSVQPPVSSFDPFLKDNICHSIETYPYTHSLTVDEKKDIKFNKTVFVFPQQLVFNTSVLIDQWMTNKLLHPVDTSSVKADEYIFYNKVADNIISCPNIMYSEKNHFREDTEFVYKNDHYYPIEIMPFNIIESFYFNGDLCDYCKNNIYDSRMNIEDNSTMNDNSDYEDEDEDNEDNENKDDNPTKCYCLTMNDKFKLDSRQTIAINIINEFFASSVYNRHILLNIGTSFGKTYLSLSIRSLIKSCNKRVLIIINNVALFDQWEKSILDMYPGTSVTKLRGDDKIIKKFNKDAQFVISNPSILCEPDTKIFERLGYTKEETDVLHGDFFSQFALAIIDEVHNFVTPTRVCIFEKISRMYNIFLSATTDETEKLKNYFSFIGKKITEKDLVEASERYKIQYISKKNNYKSTYIRANYEGPNVFTFKDESIMQRKAKNGKVMDTISFTSLSNKIAADIYRIMWACHIICQFALEGRSILLYNDRVGFLNLLAYYYKRLISGKGFIIPYEYKMYREDCSYLTDYCSFIDDLSKHKTFTEVNGFLFTENNADVYIGTSNDKLHNKYQDLYNNDMYNDPIVYTADTVADFNKSNIILSTFKSFGEGIDVVKLDTEIILASAKKYLQQYGGRIFRTTTGKDRIIYDLVNINNSITNRHGNIREMDLASNLDCIERTTVKSNLINNNHILLNDPNYETEDNFDYSLYETNKLNDSNFNKETYVSDDFYNTDKLLYRNISVSEMEDEIKSGLIDRFKFFYRKPYESID
jgi:superfamily II DNA or RNA helicase